MYFIGADNASNMIDCTTSIPNVPIHPIVPANQYITMAYSKSLTGGWQTKVILRDNFPQSNHSSWHFIQNNPSAIIMPNGTINLIFRADPDKGFGHGESLGLATAIHWNSSYVVDETPILSAGPKHGNNEDPFAWVDKRGNFHIVTHEQSTGCICGQAYGSTCGAHLYARNIRGPWVVSKYPTYTDSVTLVNGTKKQLQTRQRPQIIFDSDGNPTHLFNGGSFEGNNPDLNILTHTFAFEFDSTEQQH
eukprot:m.64857 g.64857  ORF g.64857 m.64857 type:complete len:248 (+) comp11680_c1_seq1:3-746(+)